jgi:SAM-dependent methyltransferase
MKKIKKILNLGCGTKKMSGAIGVDLIKLPDVDVVCDLNSKDWPFENESIDEIYAFHVLEHLDDTLNFMNEVHRILRNYGTINIRVPHFSHTNAYVDPTHKRFFALDTFNYFTKNSDLNFYTPIRFVITEKKLEFGHRLWNWIFNLPKIKYGYELCLSRIFPAKEIVVTLSKQ